MIERIKKVIGWADEHRLVVVLTLLLLGTSWALVRAGLFWKDFRDEVYPTVGVYEAEADAKLERMIAGEGPPLVIAHRGDHRFHYDNAIESFQRALDRGYDGVELDIVNTGEDIPVVAHDINVGPDGKYFIPESTVDDITGWADTLPEDHGVRHRPLHEIFERFGDEMVYVVELKADDDDAYGAEAAACRVIRQQGVEDVVILASLKYHVIETIAETPECDGIAYMYEWAKTEQAPTEDYASPVFGVRHDLYSNREDQFPASTQAVSVYTPNWGFQIRRSMEQGALLVQTDQPGKAMRIRKELAMVPE